MQLSSGHQCVYLRASARLARGVYGHRVGNSHRSTDTAQMPMHTLGAPREHLLLEVAGVASSAPLLRRLAVLVSRMDEPEGR
jgi:hypothetical protein